MPIGTLDDVPLEEAVHYAARDPDCTCRVDSVLTLMGDANNLGGVEAIDLGAIPMFERMQATGIGIDKRHFRDFDAFLTMEMENLRDEINDMAGEVINPGSGEQVGYVLYGKLGLSTRRRTKSRSRESTDEKTLAPLRGLHPIVGKILDYKERDKLRGTYARAIPRLAGRDGRIRGDFRVTRTPSGQLAVGSPNLLAMPVGELGKEIRRGFVAGKGNVLGSWDYQGFHFRVMAHLSRDPELIKIFTTGQDIHDITASKMFGIPINQLDKYKHRLPAKRVGFGIINGITPQGLVAQADLAGEFGALAITEQEATDQMKAWFDIYKGVRQFQVDSVTMCRRNGLVRDEWGRIRYLPNIHSSLDNLKSEAERQSFSHRIQATAHGVLKQSMAAIWTWLEWEKDINPILQIHDELIFECLDDEKKKLAWDTAIRSGLCDTVTLRVPLESSGTFALRWADLK